MTSTPKSYTPHIAASMIAIGLAVLGFSITGHLVGTMQDIGILVGAAFIGLGIFPDIATKDATIEKIDKDILEASGLLTSHLPVIESALEQALSGKLSSIEASVSQKLSEAASKIGTATSA